MKKLILSLSFCLFTAMAFAQATDTLSGQSFGDGVLPGDLKQVEKVGSVMGEKTTADMKITGEVVEVCKKKRLLDDVKNAGRRANARNV